MAVTPQVFITEATHDLIVTVKASTLWLFIASAFNLLITTSEFERYATGTLSTLTCVLSLYLVWHRDGTRLCPCRINARR